VSEDGSFSRRLGYPLVERIEAKVNPYAAFMRDCFVPGAGEACLLGRSLMPSMNGAETIADTT
jgi:hypothetical protein